MSAGSDKNKIEIDIAEEWTERIGKTANKICDDSDNNRIKSEWTTYRFNHRIK